MQIQTGPVCIRFVVCIHKLNTSSPPKVLPRECKTAFHCYHWFTDPQFHIDPHPWSHHFTYITMDQTHISFMEAVPSCPQTGWRASSFRHAETTHVPLPSINRKNQTNAGILPPWKEWMCQFSHDEDESITLPLPLTHSVLLIFHVDHAENKLTVAWLPAPWLSQENHLPLFCNTDRHNHECVAFVRLLHRNVK